MLQTKLTTKAFLPPKNTLSSNGFVLVFILLSLVRYKGD